MTKDFKGLRKWNEGDEQALEDSYTREDATTAGAVISITGELK